MENVKFVHFISWQRCINIDLTEQVALRLSIIASMTVPSPGNASAIFNLPLLLGPFMRCIISGAGSGHAPA